jgi:hypothetical protein
MPRSGGIGGCSSAPDRRRSDAGEVVPAPGERRTYSVWVDWHGVVTVPVRDGPPAVLVPVDLGDPELVVYRLTVGPGRGVTLEAARCWRGRRARRRRPGGSHRCRSCRTLSVILVMVRCTSSQPVRARTPAPNTVTGFWWDRRRPMSRCCRCACRCRSGAGLGSTHRETCAVAGTWAPPSGSRSGEPHPVQCDSVDGVMPSQVWQKNRRCRGEEACQRPAKWV